MSGMLAIMSPSARKVWIEIFVNIFKDIFVLCHLPRGRCGLKYCCNSFNIIFTVSPSARKVWIEINL